MSYLSLLVFPVICLAGRESVTLQIENSTGATLTLQPRHPECFADKNLIITAKCNKCSARNPTITKQKIEFHTTGRHSGHNCDARHTDHKVHYQILDAAGNDTNENFELSSKHGDNGCSLGQTISNLRCIITPSKNSAINIADCSCNNRTYVIELEPSPTAKKP